MSDLAAILAANEKISKETLAARADQIDRERKYPRENLEALGAAGALGISIPAEFGGAGGTLADMSKALETQARGCASTAMIAMMHYCACAVIAAKGGEEMKRQLLPAAARGQHISTLAFSEAGSGGHFYAPVSKVRLDCGEKALSAKKTFVTSAGEADSYVVSTRKMGAGGPTDCDLYLLPKGAPGFTAQGKFEGLGLAGNASAPMTLEDVRVTDGARLGAEGSGFQTMMEVVLPTFQVGVASVSIGIAGAASEKITARVGARKYEHAGGAALASIPRVQFLVAEMAIELNAARAYLVETIRKALAGDPAAMLDVLGVKVRAAEACLNVVQRAMTLGGGWAFGQRGGLERMFRDAQAASVMAPASDVLKDFIGKAALGLPLF
ncbi:MAG TPA: acyl-CoA dehydrogenase family protein [Candidatus Aquilonibacter sp.]|nr:acyl-CoA dehydrogenase family protein [Candidatus Aquilonibacter sp.]